MRYQVFVVLLTCLLSGCGGSSGDGSFVNNPTPNGLEARVPAGVPTGSVLLRTTLQPAAQRQQTVIYSSQVVPAEVTHFRTTAVDSNGALVFGPEVVVKAASVTFEGVPTTAVLFRMELLTADDTVLGAFSQPITIRAQELIEVMNPTYTFISLVGETGAEGPTGPQGETGPEISRVSVASDGTQGDFDSSNPSTSADGRYIAFQAFATNLVSGDTNGKNDIFVHDRHTSSTSRVSVASDGTQGNDHCESASISADGRYIAFHSAARNLVSGDSNGVPDIFVHDRNTSTTSRVSVASDGTQGNGSSLVPSISADGRYVTFGSNASSLVSGDTNGWADIFIHDLQSSSTTLVSVASEGTQGNGPSQASSLSADGRYVLFSSSASNLVSGDTNGSADVFVHDRQTSVTTLVSVATDGTQGGAGSGGAFISADGHYLAFHSQSTNLVSGDTNNAYDIFSTRNPLAP